MSTQPHAHEKKDVDVMSIILLAILLFLAGALIFLVAAGLMRFLAAKQFRQEAARPPAVKSGALFPRPGLEPQPAVDLQKLRAAEDERLDSYGWIDRSANVVRIPIDRAMQVLCERGLPDVGANQTPLQFMQARPQEIPSPKPQQ
jgi:hypothetical protein